MNNATKYKPDGSGINEGIISLINCNGATGIGVIDIHGTVYNKRHSNEVRKQSFRVIQIANIQINSITSPNLRLPPYSLAL